MIIYAYILGAIGSLIQAAFIYFEHKEKYVLAAILKGTASLFFVTIGIIAATQAIDTAFSTLVLIGLVLGLVGDVLLNLRFVFPKIGSKIFLVGVLSFLVGHILYLSAIIPVSSSLIYAIPIGVVVAAVILILIFMKLKVKLSYKIFGILYLGAISVMTVIAIGNVITNPMTSTIIYAIGAVFFLISDVVLIFNSFGPKQLFPLRITNLTFYYLGQILIAASLFFI